MFFFLIVLKTLQNIGEKMKTIVVLALLCGIAFFCGCSQNLARFSLVSTGNVPLADVEDGEYVTGKDCIRRILFFTFGNRNDRISGAVVDALEKAIRVGN